MLTKWTVRISSRLYLAVVLPPNTELRRMFSLSFGYQTFGTLAVSDWVSEWLSDPIYWVLHREASSNSDSWRWKNSNKIQFYRETRREVGIWFRIITENMSSANISSMINIGQEFLMLANSFSLSLLFIKILWLEIMSISLKIKSIWLLWFPYDMEIAL